MAKKVKAAYIEPDSYFPKEIWDMFEKGNGDEAKSTEKKTVKKTKKPTKKAEDKVRDAMKKA